MTPLRQRLAASLSPAQGAATITAKQPATPTAIEASCEAPARRSGAAKGTDAATA
jgi:hypothetical protein